MGVKVTNYPLIKFEGICMSAVDFCSIKVRRRKTMSLSTIAAFLSSFTIAARLYAYTKISISETMEHDDLFMNYDY